LRLAVPIRNLSNRLRRLEGSIKPQELEWRLTFKMVAGNRNDGWSIVGEMVYSVTSTGLVKVSKTDHPPQDENWAVAKRTWE